MSQRQAGPYPSVVPTRSELEQGAMAGMAATGAMSVLMLGARRLGLIDRQPPEEITQHVTDRTGAFVRGVPLRIAASLAHLAFGAIGGIVFASLLRLTGHVASPVRLAVTYGLSIWFVSYRHALPAWGLVRSDREAGVTRDVVMLVAHVVYGLVLGGLLRPGGRAGVPRHGRRRA
ncbi:MAG: hypothetical protein LH650_13740 [Chloroflexi bacterium]|nr:hypothetical protein [Chloroflexota bacterium]